MKIIVQRLARPDSRRRRQHAAPRFSLFCRILSGLITLVLRSAFRAGEGIHSEIPFQELERFVLHHSLGSCKGLLSTVHYQSEALAPFPDLPEVFNPLSTMPIPRRVERDGRISLRASRVRESPG